jgi:hypothetical protein
MVKKLSLTSIILFTIAVAALAASIPDLQEGLWEITTKMEMPGMPKNMPPIKHTQCLTKKDLVPQSPQKGQECKISQTKVDGSIVTWTMQCNNAEGTTEGHGKIAYKGNTFAGVITMTVKIPNQQNMQMTSLLNGRRIGACK